MTLVRPTPSDEASRILSLARRDRDAAREAVAARSLEEQVALVCDTPVGRRSVLLDLVPQPEAVIPLIPEAEFCFTVKAIGPNQAGWIVEYATPEQLVACVDLDGWSLQGFDGDRFREWWLAATDAGSETLLRWFNAIDPELMVLELMERIVVEMKPNDATEAESWLPLRGAQTLEGIFHFTPKRPGDDLAELTVLLRTLFEADYWSYFRLMQAVIHELESDTEEFAMRWRRGRLEDLGFPPREESAELFARPAADTLATLPDEGPVLAVGGWVLPVWFPKVPLTTDSEHAVLAAAARLPEDERSGFLHRLLAVANKVAVAYDLPLSDVESVPTALDEAVRMTSRGVEELAARHGQSGEAILGRVSLDQLFRVGAAFFPEKAEFVLSKLPVDPDEAYEPVDPDTI
ncbi:MAG: hypothetical protein JRH10_08310 [Deltaproteobacteria bacterium]|nr:hypothetical protein [Deltaproteobacteria bacterium]MBW2446291.1 hypothetical protein [Deltaproteobacteria bacterium]